MSTSNVRTWWRLDLTLALSTIVLWGCFEHPNDKVNQMVCATDINCPTSYQCIKQQAADATGKCGRQGGTSGSGGTGVAGSTRYSELSRSLGAHHGLDSQSDL
jgi:hypothetical protein